MIMPPADIWRGVRGKVAWILPGPKNKNVSTDPDGPNVVS